MAKPKVYILEKGGFGESDHQAKLGDGAYSCVTTVGLIEYEKEGENKFMLVDTGVASSLENIKKGILELGKIEDVTHILMTHYDQDHPQSNSFFKNSLVISGAGTARQGTPSFGSVEALYPNGFIENENIKFVNVGRTHSRDEMYYVVDSENEGLVIFAGDLMFAPLTELDAPTQVTFDKGFTIDVVKKYIVLKEMYEKYPELKKIFVGHSRTPLTRENLKEYIDAMGKEPYTSYMKEFISELRKRVDEYEKIV